MHKIIIVGGGTAGWLTALYLNKIAFDSEITLVESETIGILGAGEGSAALFPNFLWELGIDENDFIKNTGATFKIGINFSNWRSDGISYFHPFKSYGHLDPNVNNIVGSIVRDLGLTNDGTEYGYLNLKANSPDSPVVLPADILALHNKTPFSKVDGFIATLTKYSYHFDARLVASYLRKIAEERGVKRIEGKVEAIDGIPIKKIQVSGEMMECDFVFDCSGFHKNIIKHMPSKWISFKDKLKVDSALPFFLDGEKEFTKSYTEARAMNYGWMWQIPLQHRYGCGYVFDSSYISVEDAKKEIEEFIGKPVTFNNVINFDAGRYDKVFTHNCIAIGLSANFLEPLEATAINTIIEQLLRISKNMIENPNDLLRDEYNKSVADIVDDISDIIHLHYLTDRTDTEFWRDYDKTTVKSYALAQKLTNWKTRLPNNFDAIRKSNTFSLLSQFIIASNLHPDLINKELVKKENARYDLDNKLQFWKSTYQHQVDNILNFAIDHKEYLDKLNEQ